VTCFASSAFAAFNDDEEFEGFNKNDDPEDPDEFYNEPKTNKKQEKVTPSPAKQQPIKIVNIPAHLRTNWENFYVEIIMIIGIVIYFLNFFTGKSKNQKMANHLFQAHRGSLESQFSLVGDDGTKNLEEIREQTLENVSSIALRHDRWSNDVKTVEHDALPQLSPTKAVLRGSGPQGLPREIVLSLHETNSSSNPGTMQHGGEVQEYRLTPTTQDALADEIADVYPSRRVVDIIHQRLLKKI